MDLLYVLRGVPVCQFIVLILHSGIGGHRFRTREYVIQRDEIFSSDDSLQRGLRREQILVCKYQ